MRSFCKVALDVALIAHKAHMATYSLFLARVTRYVSLVIYWPYSIYAVQH